MATPRLTNAGSPVPGHTTLPVYLSGILETILKVHGRGQTHL